MEAQISELNAKCDEHSRNVNDLQNQKSKIQNESTDLNRLLEEAEHKVGSLTKDKQSLQAQLDEAKHSLEDETRVQIFTNLSMSNEVRWMWRQNTPSCQIVLLYCSSLFNSTYSHQ